MALQDTMVGQLQVYIGSIPSFISHVKAHKLKALATTSNRRAADLPDLPTVSEAGLPGYEMTGWYGAYAPAGIAPSIMKRLETDFLAAIRHPDTSARLLAVGAEPIASAPAEFSKFLDIELNKWARVVKASGATAE
jgi:tripartite-type tricarboxylate transporter receptor subunit TctC